MVYIRLSMHRDYKIMIHVGTLNNYFASCVALSRLHQMIASTFSVHKVMPVGLHNRRRSKYYFRVLRAYTWSPSAATALFPVQISMGSDAHSLQPAFDP
jgi:hypothetical protein